MTPTFVPYSSVLQGLSNTTYTDPSCFETSSYLYKVAAVNLVNPARRSDFSNSAAQTVLPQPVSMLVAISGNQLAQLSWNNQGVTTLTYTLQRKLGSAPDNTYQTVKTGIQGVNYLDLGLQNKTFYSYRLFTVDISQSVTYTSNPSVPAIALPPKPPIVSNQNVGLAQDSD